MIFLLFAFDTYYPSGGWHDLRSTHSTLEYALEAAAGLDYEHKHIVRIGDGIVWQS